MLLHWIFKNNLSNGGNLYHLAFTSVTRFLFRFYISFSFLHRKSCQFRLRLKRNMKLKHFSISRFCVGSITSFLVKLSEDTKNNLQIVWMYNIVYNICNHCFCVLYSWNYVCILEWQCSKMTVDYSHSHDTLRRINENSHGKEESSQKKTSYFPASCTCSTALMLKKVSVRVIFVITLPILFSLQMENALHLNLL